MRETTDANVPPVDGRTEGGGRPVPVLYRRKENCCGCTACHAACPAGAITMEPDDEGFPYPVIDPGRCVGCGRCVSACAFKRDQGFRGYLEKTVGVRGASFYRETKYARPTTYAAKHRDYDTRMASRSGGAFTALSDAVLDDGGVVYGCVLDGGLRAVHARAEDAGTRDRMRGSKYVQSDMRGTCGMVGEDLDGGRRVLFSGTPCQVAGLVGYLGGDRDNLLTVDIVCYGVPSPMVWRDYLKWQGCRSGGDITRADFRNKGDFGWRAHVETLWTQDGGRVDSRVFANLFHGRAAIRPSCYRCPYKDIIHPGNVTIGDYWGIEGVAPGLDDDRGVSLVLVNDDKGMGALEGAWGSLEIEETQIEDSMQTPLREPFAMPGGREAFWSDYRGLSFDRIARKYGGHGFTGRLRRMVRRLGRLYKKWRNLFV